MSTAPDSPRALMAPFFDDVTASPLRLAPERAAEMEARLAGEPPMTYRLVDGVAQFTAFPTLRRIDVTASGLASLWALSYVAYRYMELALRVAAGPEGQAADLLEIQADPKFAALIAYARDLFRAEAPWPANLRRPTPGAPLDTFDGCANNLFLAATGWVLLHEIGHMTLDHTEYVSEDLRRRQEHEADKFAVEWPLALASGMEREFRVLAIIVALAWLLLFEQAKRGGGDHPAAIIRFYEAADLFGVGDDSYALEAGFYALKAIYDPLSDDAPPHLHPRQAFDWIGERLISVFPRH